VNDTDNMFMTILTAPSFDYTSVAAFQSFQGTNRFWLHERLEDELHLLFECPVYDEIRKWYPALFKQSCANMNYFMNQSDQYSVAFFSSACM
jgi:hypothetical protein